MPTASWNSEAGIRQRWLGKVFLSALLAAAAILFVMWGLGRWGVRSLPVYLLLASLLWYAVLLSGVHATVAGVLAAIMIPLKATPGVPDSADSPLHRLEHALAPIVAFLIVLAFGFGNAGVALKGMALTDIVAPLPLGIAAGLFLGKQIGIFGAIWLCVRLGASSRLRGATWLQIYGVSLLCGIGFTMSLTIALWDVRDACSKARPTGSIAVLLRRYGVVRPQPAAWVSAGAAVGSAL